ncbi:hypothetical protein ACWCPX_39320 [Streptomyces olivaceoviridis]
MDLFHIDLSRMKAGKDKPVEPTGAVYHSTVRSEIRNIWTTAFSPHGPCDDEAPVRRRLRRRA